jgi:hypothetical protein
MRISERFDFMGLSVARRLPTSPCGPGMLRRPAA